MHYSRIRETDPGSHLYKNLVNGEVSPKVFQESGKHLAFTATKVSS